MIGMCGGVSPKNLKFKGSASVAIKSQDTYLHIVAVQ